MPLQLHFADHSLINSSPWAAPGDTPFTHKVPAGCPIILNERFWPAQPWTEFLRRYARNISINSAKAYGHDLFKLAQYLEKNTLTWETVTNDDLIDYRNQRLSQGLSERSWQRETVVLRAFFNFLVEEGLLNETPWRQIGRYSVIKPRPLTFEMDVRALTHEQWTRFKNIGLGGQLPDGSIDTSFRGRSTQRDTTAVEVAITTGMRVQEWRTLMLPELMPANGGGASVVLEATTKGQRRRTIYIPQKTLDDIDLYIRVERRRTIRKAQAWLSRHLPSLAVVDRIDDTIGKVTYTYQGTTYRKQYFQIPVHHRAVLVEQLDSHIEPLSLFVGTTGKPPSQRSWHDVFTTANRRLQQFDEDHPRRRRPIVPHDLRHTFAVVMLQNLQVHALEQSKPGRVGHGTISEHIISNPLLTVQRLLGHASPSTTMIYLRYIEEADALIQRAFDAWNDPLKDYSDYIIDRILADGKAQSNNP